MKASSDRATSQPLSARQLRAKDMSIATSAASALPQVTVFAAPAARSSALDKNILHFADNPAGIL
jgi:hypothetical protein